MNQNVTGDGANGSTTNMVGDVARGLAHLAQVGGDDAGGGGPGVVGNEETSVPYWGRYSEYL
jgi:hypothetical protein